MDSPPTHSGTLVWTLVLEPWPVFSFPLESFVFRTLMAAVITPAVEGMGGNFLLFYPAIPMGAGHSLPHLLLLGAVILWLELEEWGVATQLLFEGIWESKAGNKQDKQMCSWQWERERWVAKRQVKWLVQKIPEGVKGCCMNGWSVGKGRDCGQSRERDWGQWGREEKIVMVSGCEIIWVLSVFKEWRGIRGIYNDPFSVLYFYWVFYLNCV